MPVLKRINLFAPIGAEENLFAEVVKVLCKIYDPAGIRVFAPDLNKFADSTPINKLRERGLQLFILKNLAKTARALRRRAHANIFVLTDDPLCAPIWTVSQQHPGIVLLASNDFPELFSEAGSEPPLSWTDLAANGAILKIDCSAGDRWSKQLARLDQNLQSGRLRWSRIRLGESAGRCALLACDEAGSQEIAPMIAHRIKSLF